MTVVDNTDFLHTNEYHQLNTLAHLKPPARLAPPALTWHLALWIPRKKGAIEDRRRDWILHVDTFLASLVIHCWRDWGEIYKSDPELKPKAFSERSSATPGLRDITLLKHVIRGVGISSAPDLTLEEMPGSGDPYRYETFSLTFWHRGIRVKFRAVLHSEYVTLTYLAELDPCNTAYIKDSFKDEVGKHFDDVNTITNAFTSSWGPASGSVHIDSDGITDEFLKTISNLSPAADFFYNRFWAEFWGHYSRCLKPTFSASLRPAGSGAAPGSPFALASQNLAPELGSVFGDFRGVVLAPRFSCVNDQVRSGIGLPGHGPGAEDRPGALSGLRPKDLSAVVDAFLPFVEAGDRTFREGPVTPATEHTASSFLGRRAMYISSLGGHANWSAMSNALERDPVRYLLFFEPKNRWQLGRLLERLHTLGTLRLAALKDLSALNDANNKLRNLNNVLAALEASGKNPGKVAVLREMVSTIGDDCDGGLSYRIERSTYYVENFERLVKFLRIRRIEGYQPYDEFVQRRVAATWNFIRRMGARLGRARQRIDYFVQWAQYEQQNTLVEKQNNYIKQQTHLLSFAEIAAFFPIALEGSHLLYIVTRFFGERSGVAINPEWFDKLDLEAREGFFGVLVGLAYIGVICLLRFGGSHKGDGHGA